MKESQFGFEYTWSDLQPVRALMVTLIGGQIVGGGLGLLLLFTKDWFHCALFGAALATFPGFVLGIVVQALTKPGSLGDNSLMVRRIGFITFLISAVAVLETFFPFEFANLSS